MKGEYGKHPATLGLRHLALRVTQMDQSRDFYEGLLGMKPVWEPDPGSVYLSSGADNLALHLMSDEEKKALHSNATQTMDHLGFIVESPEKVRELEKRMVEAGVPMVKPYKDHRDGSSSFYMADPDGNVVQILFEPNISPLSFRKAPGPKSA